MTKSPRKLKYHINTKLDPFFHLLYSDVYGISFICADSLKRSNYIGETVTSLKIRIKEYVGDMKYERGKTVISKVN